MAQQGIPLHPLLINTSILYEMQEILKPSLRLQIQVPQSIKLEAR